MHGTASHVPVHLPPNRLHVTLHHSASCTLWAQPPSPAPTCEGLVRHQVLRHALRAQRGGVLAHGQGIRLRGAGQLGLHRCPTPAHQQFHCARQPRTASPWVCTRIPVLHAQPLRHSTQQAHLREEVAHQLLVAADLLALRSGGCSGGQAGQLGAWPVKERSGPRTTPTACWLPCSAAGRTAAPLPSPQPSALPWPPLRTCRYTSCWERATPMNSAGMTRPCGER